MLHLDRHLKGAKQDILVAVNFVPHVNRCVLYSVSYLRQGRGLLRSKACEHFIKGINTGRRYNVILVWLINQTDATSQNMLLS